MKKVIFSIFAVAAVMTVAVTINSCTKQESSEQSFNSQQSEHPQMTEEDISIYNRIVNFKKKVDYIKENPGYKSGELLEVDSAVWLMEALFNYTYGCPDETYLRTKTDTGKALQQIYIRFTLSCTCNRTTT